MKKVLALAAALIMLSGCNPESRIIATYLGTPMPMVRGMLELAKVGPNDVVYDLGSGDGRIVIMAAKEFGARGVGIDLDPKLVALARENARKAGVEDKVEFHQGDLFDMDLRPATVVTLWLFETLNVKLRPKLLAELKPGSRVVSYQWRMGDWKPDAERFVEDDVSYLWIIPKPAK